MLENYRLLMDYEGKKYEIHKLKNIVFEICLPVLSIRIHKRFLSVNTNSGKADSDPSFS
jgi:hypothetical protein